MQLWQRGANDLVTWLNGNRIRGTSTERKSTPFGQAVGGWKELGRISYGSSSPYLPISFTPKRYHMLILSGAGTAGAASDGRYQLGYDGFDTGTNYSWRFSANSEADGTSVNVGNMIMDGGTNTTNNTFGVGYITNYATKEKLHTGHYVGQSNAGASTPPLKGENVGKWTNTSNQFNHIRALTDSESQTWNAGSELIILEYDPSDTHSDNFWQELASNQASGSSTTFTIDFTAKKYLWVQGFFTGMVSDVNTTFNGDTNSNYARRYSVNGGSDASNGSSTSLSNMVSAGNSTPSFWNCFIINVSSREKLVISTQMNQNTAGAANAPQRLEFVGKWANTASQITSITQTSTSGNFGSASIMRVWGAD